MDPVGKIKAAEQQIADVQHTLDTMQRSLEKAEAVAVAAEEARNRAELLLKISSALLAVAILVLLLSRRSATSD